jgi:hypothetical protein
MKTVIFVWTYNVINFDKKINFWGIGDIIRGIICVYQICKKHNFEFIVDTMNHNISKYLLNEEHKYADFVKNNINNISFVLPENINNFIITNTQEVILLITNGFYVTPIDEDCKLFIKKLLTPIESFEKYIKYQLNYKNLTNYTITHARLGDNMMIDKHIDINKINKFYEIIKNIKSPNQILLSDCYELKTFVNAQNHNIVTYDTTICHSGQDKQDLHDTLFEFFLILNSDKINSITVYGWLSGFVNIAHMIYDIPVKQMLNM